MSLTLASGEAQARAFTRHVSDTTRLTQADLRIYLNRGYKQVRSWLVDVAPSLYLLTSTDQTVAAGAGVLVSAISATHERTFRVEQRHDDGSYRDLERADPLQPNTHYSGRYTWREEGPSILFGPDGTFSGTVRVLYHATPADISTGAFEVPVHLEMPLIFQACALIAAADTDFDLAEGWDKKAAASLGVAAGQLRGRHGAHPRRAGLQRIQGY